MDFAMIEKKIIESVDVSYNVEVQVKDLSGKIISISRGKNLVVKTGLGLLRDLIGGTGLRPDRMKAGTGVSATTAGMTDLETAVITKTMDRRIDSGYGIQFQAIIDSGEANGNTLAEVGTFQNTTMVARSLISPTIEKTALVIVTMIHTISFSATS